MEYIDILNEDGTSTGEKKPRSMIHSDGDWHRAANLWIVNSHHELLIQKRAPIKDTYPNFWDLSVCGHVQSGDDSRTTIIREAKEELNLDLSDEEFKFLLTIKEQHVLNNGKFFDNEFRDVFLLKKDLDLFSLFLQPEEVSEVKWIPLDEFERLTKSQNPAFVPHEKEYSQIFPILKKALR